MNTEQLIHQIEYHKLVAMQNRDKVFGELLEGFPLEDTEARDFLWSSRSHQISVKHGLETQTGEYRIEIQKANLLDEEKLEKLRNRNSVLYGRIYSVYMNFLKRKANLVDSE